MLTGHPNIAGDHQFTRPPGTQDELLLIITTLRLMDDRSEPPQRKVAKQQQQNPMPSQPISSSSSSSPPLDLSPSNTYDARPDPSFSSPRKMRLPRDVVLQSPLPLKGGKASTPSLLLRDDCGNHRETSSKFREREYGSTTGRG